MKIFLLLLSFLALGACAHHRDVRPGASGIHQVIIPTDDKESAARDAIAQANHFCEQRNKSAAFIEEKQNYTGSMNQGDYERGKTVSKVAKVVGGAAYVMGGKKESNVGGILGLGGVAADAALGKGYTVSMKFTCQ